MAKETTKEAILVRVDPEVKKVLQAAADRETLALSTWVRRVAVKAAEASDPKRGGATQ